MGYYTRFELSVDIPDHIETTETDIISNFRLENENAEYAIDDNGCTIQETKWYEWKDELLEFSKKYPECLFTMRGEGEESGDIWKAYVKNGKIQYTQAKLVFANFDESKLE